MSKAQKRTPPFRRVLTVVLLVLGSFTFAQPSRIDRLELAFAKGAADSVMLELHSILRTASASRDLRFEACMLMAECWYQRQSMEQFAAWNDSAATLLHRHEEERWARIEVNRCRYAHYAILPQRAVEQGLSALRRYHRSSDKAAWKHAFRIHQALGSAYRNHDGTRVFAHFDTAANLLAKHKDILPYWKAMLSKSRSNAAMDRMRPGYPERDLYATECCAYQLDAIAILEHYYTGQVMDRVAMLNLRGLYHIYRNQPDSALRWLQRTERTLEEHGAWGRPSPMAVAMFTCLRWQAFIFALPPWRNDSLLLNGYLDRLLAIAPVFADHAAKEVTAGGLFARDKYWYSPYTAIMATCHRLWEKTRNKRYIDLALCSTESARRDAWNAAQPFRNGYGHAMGAPPQDMLQELQDGLLPNEGVMVCAEHTLSGRSTQLFTIAVTATHAAFYVHDLSHPNVLLPDAMERSELPSIRQSYHELYCGLYKPVEAYFSHIERVKVLANGATCLIAFDALLADTASQDLFACHPLVERHAFSYPFFILKPEAAGRSPVGSLYIAPTPGHGDLTDLAYMRKAIRRWSERSPNTTLDSSFTRDKLRTLLTDAGSITWGGHCGGALYRDEQPYHYAGTSTQDPETRFQPSDLLPLNLCADLVIHAACRSSMHDADGSSGAISFTRAFLFAGARSVVGSLFLADEASSVRLLDLLQEQLANGLPTDLALQQAKSAYLSQVATTEEARPLYWATWQMWGEPVTLIDQHASDHVWWWVVGVVVITASGFAWFRARES
ncbi:MAG TPA: CHAT domain-containing protein [Flavobacteriales bacterium]|nr:CHAT domain-containing protein [Flavobacteriales bacterium]